MIEYDVIIVGAGPAGLGAAIEAARAGARPLLLDENDKPGGQLFKQIHKFFGSKEHYAGMRGFAIGQMLLGEAQELGVEFRNNTKVWAIFPDLSVSATDGEISVRYKAKKVILATGASENALSFPGCTLPGVITAGAAQTMVNVHNVLPGKQIAVVGSGNVGLIVSYQLMQAGARIPMILEALPAVGGYAVHAAKVRRAGVPILTGHTVMRGIGTEALEAIEIVRLDERLCPVPGTARIVPCDTLCIAVGLSPRVELACVSKCEMAYAAPLGGMLPRHNRDMETSHEDILVAGDLAGVEEASTALDEGRLAGIRAAYRLGCLSESEYALAQARIQARLDALRQGAHGEARSLAKQRIWQRG
ncbi:MAG: FAD-dependent oxidoreductase [Bacillota bacterium]